MKLLWSASLPRRLLACFESALPLQLSSRTYYQQTICHFTSWLVDTCLSVVDVPCSSVLCINIGVFKGLAHIFDVLLIMHSLSLFSHTVISPPLSDMQEETNVSLHARRMPKSRMKVVKGRGATTGCLLLQGSRGMPR